MIEPAADPAPEVPVRRLSGPTWAGLAFVAGTLFALLPMYYFYAGSAAPQRESVQPVAGQQSAAPLEPPVRTSGQAPERFASRMTYELSQTPEEPPPQAVAATPAPATGFSEPATVAVRRELPEASEERAGGRIANARPISATPPDPRDTTREIENEARRAEYSRSPSRPPPRAQESSQGRESVGAVKASVATRPIGASTTSRAPDEADSGSRLATALVIGTPERKGADAVVGESGAPVAGVHPIGAAPDAPERKGPGAADAVAANVTDVESRLAATREWLSAAPQTMHTIQIMGTNSEDQLKSQLRTLSKVLEPQKIYVFRTYAQGKPAMTVVYGGYADRQAAQQALEKLPPSVSANKPVLRTVNGIRTELKQHGIKTES